MKPTPLPVARKSTGRYSNGTASSFAGGSGFDAVLLDLEVERLWRDPENLRSVEPIPLIGFQNLFDVDLLDFFK